MKNEIEAKFVNIDIDDIRDKLRALGATLVQPLRDMRRVTIDSPTMQAKNAFLRVRDEGNKTTLTYKQFNALSIDGVKEVEVEVSNFDNTIILLAEVGLAHSSTSRLSLMSGHGLTPILRSRVQMKPRL